MEVYILKSVACLGVLFGFYKLVLENTSLHTTKRFYLLASVLVSVLIPFITFTSYIEVVPITNESVMAATNIETPMNNAAERSTNYLPYLLGGLYGLGVLLFSLRFGSNIRRILKNARQHPTIKKSSLFHVLLNFQVTPHSFFSYIFFNKSNYEAGNIPQEVIAHETAHVQQKHSWDIVFFELFRIVFWFNPLCYFIKKSIKLNHEFLADRAVLNQGADTTKYQHILLDFSSGSGVQHLAHSINYSSIKKRFTVMKTHTSSRTAWFKRLLVLPLLALLIYGFSNKETVAIPAKAPTENQINHTDSQYSILDIKATPEQIEIYNRLAKKYNAVPIEKRKIGGEDLKTLENIYRLMDADQKERALPFPECKQKEKVINISVDKSTISINSNKVTLQSFAGELDKITMDWTIDQIKKAHMNIQIRDANSYFMEKLELEYKKTQLYQHKKHSLIPPPPPAPDAPRAIQNVNGIENKMPPPPPPAPNTPTVVGSSRNITVPPPPPPPVSPLDHVIKMAKMNATFFYEGKEITSDKAVELIKTNENLNIQTTGHSSKNPQVRISKKAITIDKN
ncbi:MAG: M56 family metallopeptidase [Marinirhabdus sp.]|nr:M56 family metallopeptidase [Marinirhabdus sp.]